MVSALMQDESMALALKDLQLKATPMNAEHYGDLQFVLAYTATYNSLQFHTINATGEVWSSCYLFNKLMLNL